MKLTRSLRFLPGYDKRPEYGIHGATLAFAVTGRWGSVVFDVNITCMTPPSVESDWEPVGEDSWPRSRRAGAQPFYARNIYVHSKIDLGSAEYPWSRCPKDCIYSPNGFTSTLGGEYRLLMGLCELGEDFIFTKLETIYKETFDAIESFYDI